MDTYEREYARVEQEVRDKCDDMVSGMEADEVARLLIIIANRARELSYKPDKKARLVDEVCNAMDTLIHAYAHKQAADIEGREEEYAIRHGGSVIGYDPTE